MVDAAVQKRAVVRDEQKAGLFGQIPADERAARLVEMVRRLVDEQIPALAREKQRQQDLRLLAAGKYPHLTLNIFCRQTTLCQCCATLILREGRELLPQCFQTGFGCALHFLLKIADVQIISLLHRSEKRRDLAQNTAEQCRLTDTVCAGQHQTLPSLHQQINGTG